MADYSNRPDYYCDFCRGDIWIKDKKDPYITVPYPYSGDKPPYTVHKRCLWPIINFTMAVKMVVKERF